MEKIITMVTLYCLVGQSITNLHLTQQFYSNIIRWIAYKYIGLQVLFESALTFYFLTH